MIFSESRNPEMQDIQKTRDFFGCMAANLVTNAYIAVAAIMTVVAYRAPQPASISFAAFSGFLALLCSYYLLKYLRYLVFDWWPGMAVPRFIFGVLIIFGWIAGVTYHLIIALSQVGAI